VTTVAAEPLAVWDVNGGYHKWPLWREAYEWALAQGLRPDDATRMEFYLVDIPFARADYYKVNDAGRRYLDAGREPAMEEVTVPLSELPPERLRVFQ